MQDIGMKQIGWAKIGKGPKGILHVLHVLGIEDPQRRTVHMLQHNSDTNRLHNHSPHSQQACPLELYKSDTSC